MHFYLVPGVPYALLPGARYLGYHRKVLNIWIGMIKLSIAVKGLRLSMAMLSYNRMTVSICSDGMMKCMIKLSIAMKGLKKKHLTLQY